MSRRQSLIHMKNPWDLYHNIGCFYAPNRKDATTAMWGQVYLIPEPADNHFLIKVWAASRGHVWTGIRGHLSAQCLNIGYNTTSHRLKSYVVQLPLLLSKATDRLQGHR